MIDRINAKGYGLTMGLHTRIDETINTVIQRAEVGNLYINRNIVGAVVGVQPFGGEGLSGTGPKAGGPLYMYRLMEHCSEKVLATPFAVKAEISNFDAVSNVAYQNLLTWAKQNMPHAIPTIPAFVLVSFTSCKAQQAKAINILSYLVIVCFLSQMMKRASYNNYLRFSPSVVLLLC